MAEKRPGRVTHPSGGKSRTKQADALETDVNKIVARYRNTGHIPNDGRQPQYGDFSNVGSYLDAMNRVREAQAQFDDLPAHVRAHVDNDPAKFLDMVYDPERRTEWEELGLVEEQTPPDTPPETKPPEPPEPPDQPPAQ